ncbi:hypothetical protein [Caenimonas soli]|uniref:hypothetical protein n=1 Tax=Caenimonas soli TaxID=2735555 RepID=UPI001A9C10EC|nr:hypothetical protein [Caenimonas soli]
MWWTRAFRRHVEAEGGWVASEVTVLATTWEFLGPSLNDYHLPDQAAQAKARVLLERALTPQQRRDLLAKRCFYVKGKRFNYRIREGHSGNVDALDSSGRVISRLCAHPLGRVPVYDMMLAQKLWIETDETMFLENAAPYPLQY